MESMTGGEWFVVGIWVGIAVWAMNWWRYR